MMQWGFTLLLVLQAQLLAQCQPPGQHQRVKHRHVLWHIHTSAAAVEATANSRLLLLLLS